LDDGGGRAEVGVPSAFQPNMHANTRVTHPAECRLGVVDDPRLGAVARRGERDVCVAATNTPFGAP
jgi:hypothetical protein